MFAFINGLKEYKVNVPLLIWLVIKASYWGHSTKPPLTWLCVGDTVDLKFLKTFGSFFELGHIIASG